MKKLLIAATLAIAATTTACSTMTAEKNNVAANKETMKTALTAAFGEHDPASVGKYFANPYIQHNPIAPSGVAPLLGMIKKLSQGPKGGVEIHRMIGEGDLVASHATYTGFGPVPLVAFDVFRFNKDGKIVEHWDNMIPVAKPNPSGHTQTDGTTEITDLDKTEANKAKVAEFITKSLIKHEKVDITQYISPVTYTQHNPAVADGLAGFGAFMGSLAKKGITMEYTKVHKVIGEGNFVLALSEGAFGGKPTAYYDLFRLENGLIVEHWDVITDMPAGKLPAGYPGKF